MEPISPGVGIFALVGLFDNAMACLNHVQVAKSLGADLHVFIILLECLQLRLTRWAVAVGINKNIADVTELKTTVLTKEELKQQSALLGPSLSSWRKLERPHRAWEAKSLNMMRWETRTRKLVALLYAKRCMRYR